MTTERIALNLTVKHGPVEAQRLAWHRADRAYSNVRRLFFWSDVARRCRQLAIPYRTPTQGGKEP